MLALDVDGVLTDGSIRIDDRGVETKRFDVRDGLAITTWIRLGLDVAIITRRSGEALRHRARELGIRHIVQGSLNKAEALASLALDRGIDESQIAYIGDDWPDMPALRRAGYPIAVADAAPEVRALAAYITTRRGGHGAVREAVEHLLRGLGRMDEALAAHD